MRFALIFVALLFLAQGAQAQQACDTRNQDSCDDELLSASKCVSAFEKSSARLTCIAPSAEAVDNDRCKIRAGCRRKHWDEWKWSEITVRYKYAGSISNCDGNLKRGLC